MAQEIKTVSEQYVEKVLKNVDTAQETNTIPTVYSFAFNGKNFVMTLPRSVMMQKRLVHLRNEYLRENTFETEEPLVKAIIDNTTIDNHSVGVNDLEFNELEVVKTAYMDELLLPLSLGGDKAITEYMKIVLGK